MSLATPFRDLPAWADYLSRVEIPVLPKTAVQLAELALREEEVYANAIADVISIDPMMSVKVYRHVAVLRRKSQATDVETLTGCVVMLGVPPFFRAFNHLVPVALPTVEPAQPLQGLPSVLSRARRAREFAIDWAIRRNDFDAEVIGTAALLHEVAEMLLWCVAPVLAAKVRDLQAANPAMRSVTAQKSVLNVEMPALQHELLQRWHLPELLVKITGDSDSDDPQVRNVHLAVALARHSSEGWENPALPDDYAALGRLLNVSAAQARALVMPE